MIAAANIVVVYDADTGEVAMTVIPDFESQMKDILSRAAIDFPDGEIALVPINDVQKGSFTKALENVAPDAVITPKGAQDALVANATDNMAVSADLSKEVVK